MDSTSKFRDAVMIVGAPTSGKTALLCAMAHQIKRYGLDPKTYATRMLDPQVIPKVEGIATLSADQFFAEHFDNRELAVWEGTSTRPFLRILHFCRVRRVWARFSSFDVWGIDVPGELWYDLVHGASSGGMDDREEQLRLIREVCLKRTAGFIVLLDATQARRPGRPGEPDLESQSRWIDRIYQDPACAHLKHQATPVAFVLTKVDELFLGGPSYKVSCPEDRSQYLAYLRRHKLVDSRNGRLSGGKFEFSVAKKDLLGTESDRGFDAAEAEAVAWDILYQLSPAAADNVRALKTESEFKFKVSVTATSAWGKSPPKDPNSRQSIDLVPERSSLVPARVLEPLEKVLDVVKFQRRLLFRLLNNPRRMAAVAAILVMGLLFWRVLLPASAGWRSGLSDPAAKPAPPISRMEGVRGQLPAAQPSVGTPIPSRPPGESQAVLGDRAPSATWSAGVGEPLSENAVDKLVGEFADALRLLPADIGRHRIDAVIEKLAVPGPAVDRVRAALLQKAVAVVLDDMDSAAPGEVLANRPAVAARLEAVAEVVRAMGDKWNSSAAPALQAASALIYIYAGALRDSFKEARDRVRALESGPIVVRGGEGALLSAAAGVAVDQLMAGLRRLKAQAKGSSLLIDELQQYARGRGLILSDTSRSTAMAPWDRSGGGLSDRDDGKGPAKEGPDKVLAPVDVSTLPTNRASNHIEAEVESALAVLSPSSPRVLVDDMAALWPEMEDLRRLLARGAKGQAIIRMQQIAARLKSPVLARDPECPALAGRLADYARDFDRMVYVGGFEDGPSAFYIYCTEVSVKDYNSYTQERGGSLAAPSGGRNYATDDDPVTGLSFRKAWGYARAQGGRIPTEGEWRRIVMGGEKKAFFQTAGRGELDSIKRENPHPTTNTATNDRVVGSVVSKDEIYYLAGNVREWVASEADPQRQAKVFGSAWRDQDSSSAARLSEPWETPRQMEDREEDDIGFRYVRDVAPQFLTEWLQRHSAKEGRRP